MYGKSFEPLNHEYNYMVGYFKDIQRTINNSNGMSLILVADPQCKIAGDTDLGEYVGYASIYEVRDSDTGDPYVHIPELCINPKFKGFGFSHRMLDMLLNRASNKYVDCEWVDLNVEETNDIAHELYKKHGFSDRFKFFLTPEFRRQNIQHFRMAKPLHDNFAFHIYPCFNPEAENKPGIPEYYTESAKYPVQRFTYYTKKLYGEMIRYNYSIYDDDPSLSRKEVNAKAKHDASTLLSAIDRDPKNFKVYCAVTEVSIAGFVVMMRGANGFWTLMLEHYYDTDRKDLLKLIEFAVKECNIDKDPESVLETMLGRDALRGKCKTKYRSMYTFNDYKDTILPQPEVTDDGELVVPEKDRFSTVPTPIPNSQPQEPTLRGTEFRNKDVVKPAAVSPKVAEPTPAPEPEKPRFSTVPTQVPTSRPTEPPSKTKIYIAPKPVVVPTKPDVPPPAPKIPPTPNIPEKVEKPLDIKNAPNVKGSLGNYEVPEAEDADEGIPLEIKNITNDMASDFENSDEVRNSRLPSMSTRQNQNFEDELMQIIDEPDEDEEGEALQ